MPSILSSTDNHITTITINRPEVKNAVDRPTALALSAAFRSFEADDNAYVAILTGANGTFCAGADLKAVADEGELQNELSEIGDSPMGPCRMMLSKPVIAAVSGHAVAGGLELACWCDMRIVEASTIMGVFCRRWGVPLVDGGTIRLTRLIGMSRAMDMILTGRPVSADEALQMGLANRVVPDGTALSNAIEIAQSLVKFPQQCMRNDRRSTYDQWNLPMEEALLNEFRLGMQTIHSKETHIGAQRFKSGMGRHGDFENI